MDRIGGSLETPKNGKTRLQRMSKLLQNNSKEKTCKGLPKYFLVLYAFEAKLIVATAGMTFWEFLIRLIILAHMIASLFKGIPRSAHETLKRRPKASRALRREPESSPKQHPRVHGGTSERAPNG